VPDGGTAPIRSAPVEPRSVLVECFGTLHTEEPLTSASTTRPAHVFVAPGATLQVGRGVVLGAGVTIVVRTRVEIGDGVRIGDDCALVDELDPNATSMGTSIVLGPSAVLSGENLVLRGALIPRGARVPSGVRVGAGTFVSAVDSPAYAQGVLRVRDVLASVHAGASALADGDDLKSLTGWDSLTALRCLVALERAFGRMLPPDLFRGPTTLGELTRAVLGLPGDGELGSSLQRSHSVRPPSSDVRPDVHVKGRYGRSFGDQLRKAATEVRHALTQVQPHSAALRGLGNVLPEFTFPGIRARLLQAAGAEVRDGTSVFGRVNITGGPLERLHVGEDCRIGPNVTFGLDGHVYLGRGASVSPDVVFSTATHELGIGSTRMDPVTHVRDVHVGEGAWIGMGALILAGVRLGPGCVVSAGAVVTQDVPADTLVAGNPAVPVRSLPAGDR
jgi:maltose O-acetyltransferase